MIKTAIRIGTAILTLSLATVPTAADEARLRSFDIRILDSDVAEELVLRQCGPAAPCEIVNIGPSRVEVLAESQILNKISAALAAAQKVPGVQVFQVTLIEAILNGDSGIQNVPEPARKALADARSFLPFNGYKLLGTAVLRTGEGATAIVNGPDDVDYNCEIRFHYSVTRHGPELVLRRFMLQRMPPQTEFGQYLEGASAVDVLNTSFSMKPGETVVVGTSKLEGAHRALVVLLTALPS